MKVNLMKTKIVIMNPGPKSQNAHFFFNKREIEITYSYKYLGTIIDFVLAKEELKNKGLKHYLVYGEALLRTKFLPYQ